MTHITYPLTKENAADLLTAASIHDVLNHRGRVTLPDSMRQQYHEQLAEVEGNLPSDVARDAWAEVADRDSETPAAVAMFEWLREQNVTN